MKLHRFRTSIFFVMVSITSFLFLCINVFAADERCQYCGMERADYGHSWVIIEHEDGTECGLCSVHCAAIDMALHTDKPVKKITVGDYNTKKQIDAEKAYWIIGGDLPGVMTARAKWAFESRAEADSFMSKYGGKPANFDAVMKASFDDMYADTLMIQKKKQQMKMKKDKKS
ncbi:MAG: nitrous oxide reductase accessory protein NosL [Desulforhabdus sp.]|jgi:nitrous oxide reductase accessory protein NosL|nr:nitrous oxide reductase accessory protein NosL [Desulforhabdus sp.]